MKWVMLDDATPEQVRDAEAGLRTVNEYVDHVITAIRQHKARHRMCLPHCPGEHFISDLNEWLEDLKHDEDAEGAEAVLMGMFTVMATRLAGFDTD